MEKRVAVIGAGVGGLAASKACLEEGLLPFVYEKGDKIGGLWNYDGTEWTDSTGPHVYKSLVTNTSKELTAFSDFPFPEDWAPYLTHQQVLQYLHMYADHFNLRKHIQFHHEVTQIEKAWDYDVTGKWLVHVESDGLQKEETFDYVIICTGFFSKAAIPSYPGLENFGGIVIHSNQYRTHDKFVDKNVLVVGNSFSAGDVAVDVSTYSKQVYLSMRDGCFVFPKRGSGGWPIDVVTNTRWRLSLPEWLNRMIFQRFLEKDVNYEALGLKTKRKLFHSKVIANDFILNQIIHGKVKTRPGIKMFFDHGVEFEDGTRLEDVDAIVFGTGYALTTPFISDDILSDDIETREVYKYILPARLKHNTLACVGLLAFHGSAIPGLELQSRWATRLFRGDLVPPRLPEILGSIEAQRQAMYDRFGKHGIWVTTAYYCDDLAADIGCLPNLLSLAFSDPVLALHMLLSPAVPPTYRLVGPKSWNGAREAVMKCWEKNISGTRGRVVESSRKESGTYLKLVILAFVLLLSALVMTYFFGIR